MSIDLQKFAERMDAEMCKVCDSWPCCCNKRDTTNYACDEHDNCIVSKGQHYKVSK